MPLVSMGPSSSDHLKNRSKWRMSICAITTSTRGQGPLALPLGSEDSSSAEVQAATRIKPGTPSTASSSPPSWRAVWKKAATFGGGIKAQQTLLRAYNVCCSLWDCFIYSQQLLCGQELWYPLEGEETEVTGCSRPRGAEAGRTQVSLTSQANALPIP